MITGLLKILFALVTEPSSQLSSPHARRQARLAASLFGLTVVFAVIQVAVFALSRRELLWIELVYLLLLVLVQCLCRTVWSRIAIAVGLLLTLLSPLFFVAVNGRMENAESQLLLHYTIIGILLTYLIYGGFRAVVITLLSIAGMVVTIYINGDTLTSVAVISAYALQGAAILLVLILLQRHEASAARGALASQADHSRSVRLILDNIADIVLMTDQELVIQYVNLTATKILGYESAEFEARSLHTVFDIMHPDDRSSILSALQQVMATQSSIRTEYRLRAKSGEYVWLETICNFLFGAGGKIEGIVFTGRDISPRKTAEAAHARDQRLYETLVNSIDGVVWVSGTLGRIDFVSRQVEEVLGVAPEQLIGSAGPAIGRIHPDDLEPILALKRQKTERREDHRLEYRLINREGNPIWVRETIKFLVDEDGSSKILGLVVNITDLKEAQAAERQQRQFSEALRASAAEMTNTVQWDEVLDGILRQARDIFSADCMNILLHDGSEPRIIRSYGYEQFGIQPKTDTQEIEIPEYERLHAFVEQDTGQSVRRLHSHTSAPIRVNGEVVAVINLDKIEENAFDEQAREKLQAFADQSSVALRNAQLYLQVKRYAEELEFLVAERTEALLKERRQLQTILNAMTEGVAYTEGTMEPGAPLTTVYVNPALVNMTGYDASNLMRTNLSILLDPAERESRAAQNRADALAHVRQQGVWRTEMKLIRSDGRPIDIYAIASGVEDSASNLVGVVTVVRDVSEEKALADHRERFIAHASHELRTPVTNLLTRLYLARKRPTPVEPHLDLLDEIASRMKQLVDDLLDVSRMDRDLVQLKRTPIVINDLLQSVVRLQQGEADKKRISLRFDSDTIQTTLNVDPARLTQVVTNLISNAINYTPEGGAVTLCLETLHAERRVNIIVADTGVGIPDEHLAQIFKPFFRVPNETIAVKGSGLGLAISKEIVDLHGGTLTAESEQGKGSRFIVRLPLS